MLKRIALAFARLFRREASAPAEPVVEYMRCGDRDSNPLADMSFPGQDHWRVMPDGSRTCSFCGSLHEDDYLAILEAYANGEPGFHFDLTSKGYKRYANRPGVRNAAEGGIKFYGWHADRSAPGWERHVQLHDRAVERYRRDMNERYGASKPNAE